MNLDTAQKTLQQAVPRFRRLVGSYSTNRAIGAALDLANRSGATYPRHGDSSEDLKGALLTFERNVNQAGRGGEQPLRRALTHGYLTLEANVLAVLTDVVATLKSAERTTTSAEHPVLRRGSSEVAGIVADARRLHADLFEAFQAVK